MSLVDDVSRHLQSKVDDAGKPVRVAIDGPSVKLSYGDDPDRHGGASGTAEVELRITALDADHYSLALKKRGRRRLPPVRPRQRRATMLATIDAILAAL